MLPIAHLTGERWLNACRNDGTLRERTPPTSLSASVSTMVDTKLTHDLCDTQKDAHDVDTEPRMREERVKYDSQTLATARDAERVERNDEICNSIAWQAYRKHGENREDKAGYDLERGRDGYGSKEKRLDSIDAIIVVPVEYITLYWVRSDVVQHADEIKRRDLDQEAHTILDGEVIVFQRCEEKC